MDFHEIDTVGKIWIERVATLPSWTSADVGRIVYAIDVDEYYMGKSTSWVAFSNFFGSSTDPVTFFAGYVRRPLFEYSTSSSISINPGRYHHNGSSNGERILKWDSSLSYSFTSLGTSEWQYLYIDNSALSGETLTAAMLRNSTTGPSWSDTKLGWYSGQDRCILALRINSSGSIKSFYHDSKFIRWDAAENRYDAAPSSSWSTATLYLPNFSKWAHCTFYQDSGQDGKNVYFYWRESNSTGSGYIIGRHYVDDGGDNQGNHQSIVVEPRVVTDITNKQIDIKQTSSGYGMRIYQNGYYLPYGF